MSTIVKALKSKKENLRVTNNDKWLEWDNIYEVWIVCYRAHRTVTLYKGINEIIAVQILLNT